MTLDFLYWNMEQNGFNFLHRNEFFKTNLFLGSKGERMHSLKLPILSFIFPLLILWTNSNDKFTYWILVQQFYQVYYRSCDTDRDTMKWRKC